ncbi:TPR-like protein [Aspergillus fijiensis CBS 313.89]|uniref:TPR-like protein n=1 Tax=Aspergillus fijiensis CBS 313.89 TaxID=1448319 RepID=A0A8G1RTR0_9EURO|nr:TPR-like protein [Aspergillus fijiensis CBS 313.89]RAK77680.1 TPR-like protein [Aspergillus fijiensis CBS 313.89]
MTRGPIPASADYFDLGTHSRAVTTSSEDARVWFNRGLVWVYSFHHGEAVHCFEQAIQHDPSFAMGYWGLAYAVGPNYNKAWERFDRKDLHTCVQRGHEASQKALELSSNATPLEQGLCRAIVERFPRDTPLSPEDYGTVNCAYADAMKPVYEQFGCDLDIATLYADALMNVTPWALWDLFTGKANPKARTTEVQAVLETALTQTGAYRHPGLLHLYIHFIEMSPTPEKGIYAADHLRDLVPDAGHMHHMPTHLDILIGDWRASIRSNYRSTLADDRYAAKAGHNNFYTFYRLHDYHSLVYAAMFAGQKRTALDAVTRMEASIPETLLRTQSPPMADWIEHFVAIRLHVMVRFGMWEELKQIPLPEDQALYAITAATTHYARALAHAATNDIPSARSEQALFLAARERVPPTRRAYNSQALDMLAVGIPMLTGEIEYRAGHYGVAFAALQEAIELEDRLPYSEPWAWMQPVRHAYAALKLEQGEVEEAARTYRADLGLDESLIRPRRHPNNVWALHGYHECLVRLGKAEEAKAIEPARNVALAGADIPIRASCFCRLEVLQDAKCCGGESC